jgi:hypothetical protein
MVGSVVGSVVGFVDVVFGRWPVTIVVVMIRATAPLRQDS